MQRTHGVTHWDPDTCYGCRLQTVAFAPSCFETTPGGRKAAAMNRGERELGKDLDAFKRMRLAGEQPPRTRGAARIESECESSFEIKTAQPAHRKAKGADARSDRKSQRGKEWRRRANEVDRAMQRGEVVHA